ncbi:MAG: alpha/beta hydrolase [Patescibacteria group bacterium]
MKNTYHFSADQWFAEGQRVPYDNVGKCIVFDASHQSMEDGGLHVWQRVTDIHSSWPWVTMLPGFPDGSFGFVATEEYLKKSQTRRLYAEYVGMGDSDKPKDYAYSTVERADMVEALWKHHGIEKTALVTFDIGSLVALELLSRFIEKRGRGETPHTTITDLVCINGGLYVDSHSHPLMTTPFLKTVFGLMLTRIAQHSPSVFKMMAKPLWSKEYAVSDKEIAENHNAIRRRDGATFLSRAAGVIDEHKRNATRWDLTRIFDATYPAISYTIAGSEEDPFEWKQVVKAKKELGGRGVRIVMFPGGHMTTSEHPNLIADVVGVCRGN